MTDTAHLKYRPPLTTAEVEILDSNLLKPPPVIVIHKTDDREKDGEKLSHAAF